MPFLDVEDGVALFYTDEGSGDPILLVHGWTCDSHDWMWQIPALERAGRRVIAADLRGHGRSAASSGGYRPPVFAADLARLLDHLSVAPAAVMGHSLGTVVATTLAVERPDLVSALVLVDPVYGIPPDLEPLLRVSIDAFSHADPVEVARGLFRFFYTERTPPHLPAWHLRRVAGVPPQVIAGTLAGLYAEPEAWTVGEATPPYLRRRRVPVLAFYVDEARAAAEREALPDDGISRIVVWSGAGHFLHQERPDEFNRAVLEWLSRALEAPGGGAATAGR